MVPKLGAVLAGCAVAVAGGAASPVQGSSRPEQGDGESKSARVNMEHVLKAAQWDPRKPDTGITPRAKESVLRVERALADKGYLSRSYVDGHFGTSTVSAYAAWQRHLGYAGLAATGLPGETSLTKLGKRRFKVTRIVVPGAMTTYGRTIPGAYAPQKVNTRTKRMLKEAAHKLRPNCELALTQGSYNPGGVDPSAGTHDGGGAADISVGYLCGKRPRAVVRVLRRVGFAAWHRLATSEWPEHIHAIAISDPDLSSGAQHQAGDYYQGRNGLADLGPDRGPQVPKRTWEQYKRRR